MNVVNQCYPTPEQLMPLAEDAGSGPIAMLNLLKFHAKARYPDGRDADLSGRDAYRRYVDAMIPIVERGGGRLLFTGVAKALVVGEVDDLWDDVGIVEYPSPAAFYAIATSPEVQAIGVHREAGLAGQLLIYMKGDGLSRAPR